MSLKVMNRAAKHSRFRGPEYLALYALAYSADDDGLYWPISWNNEAARARTAIRSLHALEQAGEVIRLGADRTMRFWVAIAFTPREMKEIAMRRFRMTDQEATAFVSGIVDRQLN